MDHDDVQPDRIIMTAHADPVITVIAVEMPSDFETVERQKLNSIEDQMGARLGCRVLIVPAGCKVVAIPTGGVYHRERIGEYEYEIIAKNEAAVLERIKTMNVYRR